ncbi:MAG: hypothetical protein ABH849_03360 [Nanoarchaeota archaeon]
MMLLIEEFLDKIEDFESLPFIEQIKYMAYIYVKTTKDSIFTPKNIIEFFEIAHLHQPTNMSDLFRKLSDKKKKVFVSFKGGYMLSRKTFKEIDSEFGVGIKKRKTSKTFKDLLNKIKDKNESNFLKEAMDCYDINSFRASIIMTWLLVINHLYSYIMNNKLNEFNKALNKQKLRIKKIKKIDDFTEIKEDKFIELARAARIITNDVRKILDEKLGIRNTCAHPNSIIVSETKATLFIEDLIENVLLKY